MNLVLVYQDILRKFNSDLINKLRKHGSDINYLNLWVPDENFLRSFKSLIDSLNASKINNFTLNVKKIFLNNYILSIFKKSFPDADIYEKEDHYIIFVKNLNKLNLNKKIIDKVYLKEKKKIDYSYGSLKFQKNNKKIRKFFLNFYNENIEEEKKNYQSRKKIKSLLFKIDNQSVFLDFNEKEEFVRFRSDTEDKYILGCLFFFNKIFFKRKLTHIASNGISEFLEIVNEKCKNQVTGILLPFNHGYEVFFVNLLCQKIIKKFSGENIKPTYKTFWFKKTLREKKELCKLTLKKFLKITNEIPNSIIFNNIQKDINKMPIRIIVSTSELINTKQKPTLIRNLEKFIKEEIDESLQVLHEEKKDLNKIRRL